MAEKLHTLDEVHNGLFEMLKFFADFCQQNGLTYFLDSGTLLGAVRHSNFIPWDDDVDLVMPRQSYCKLLQVAHLIPSPYKLVLPNDYGGHFFDFVPRIVNTEFVLREPCAVDIKQNNNQNYLSVDLFILDNAPNSVSKFKKVAFKQKMIYGYAMAHRVEGFSKPHGFMDRLKIAVLRLFGKCKKLDKIIAMQEKLCTKYQNENTDFVYISNYTMKAIHLCFHKEYFASSVKKYIRDSQFDCPVGYHEFLTEVYGDYMTPPRQEDQKPTHI